MNDIFVCESGRELHLQPVNSTIAGSISRKMLNFLTAKQIQALMSEKVSNEAALSLFGDHIGTVCDIGDRLFSYCAGWGVKDDPPQTDNELMQLLGISSDTPHLRRAEWVRSLMSSDREGQSLVKAVLELSNRPPPGDGDEQIAELRAQIEALRG